MHTLIINIDLNIIMVHLFSPIPSFHYLTIIILFIVVYGNNNACQKPKKMKVKVKKRTEEQDAEQLLYPLKSKKTASQHHRQIYLALRMLSKFFFEMKLNSGGRQTAV